MTRFLQHSPFSTVGPRVRPLLDIPGPRAWPVIGSTADLFSRCKGFIPPEGPQLKKAFHEYYEAYGSTYRLTMVGDQHVHVCKPEDYLKMYRHEGMHPPGAAEMLWPNKRWAARRGLTHMQAFLSRGEDWRQLRMALQEDIISPKAARTFLPFMNEACRLASPNFRAHADSPDVFVTRLAFDMFTAVLFGIQMKCAAGGASEKDLEFVGTTQKLLHLMGTLIFHPHLKWKIFSGHKLNREFDEVNDRSYDDAKELLRKAIEASKSQPSEEKPYIVKLIEGGKLPMETVEEIVPTLLQVGIDTTQSVMNWNLLYLAQNPEKQDKLREELTAVLGREGAFAPEHVAQMSKNLPYLRAVVRETHRLAPASPLMTQRTAPCDLEMDGYQIPEGTTVSFNVYSLQNDPKYVERPEEFLPERWLPDAVKARKGTEAEVIDHKLLATPFSFGARMCIGGRVAELETYAMLCQLVRDWRLRTADEQPAWEMIQPLQTKASPYPGFFIEAAH